MRSRELTDTATRTFVLVFDPGDEVAEGLLGFAREQGIAGAHFTAIGALRGAVLGYWDGERKEYERIPIEEQVEVLALVGNVAQGPDGGPKIHAHLVVGKRDGTAHGGHLLEAQVFPTLEVVLVEAPMRLRRRTDEATGLPLLVP